MASRRLVSRAVLWGLVAFSSMVHAADVRFVPRDDNAFERRVKAELENVGLSVQTVVRPEEPLAGDELAIVRVTEQAVEVWRVDTTRGAILAEAIPRDPNAEPAVDAMRVAERLRATLQPLVQKRAELAAERSEQEPVAKPPAPTPPSAPPTRTAAPRAPPPPDSTPRTKDLRLTASVAALSQPESPSFGAELLGAVALGRGLWLEGVAFLPVTSSQLERAGSGSATLDARLLGAFLGYDLLQGRDGGVALTASAGIYGAWLRASGESTSTLRAQTDDTLTSVPAISLAARYAVSDGAWLAARGFVGVAVPQASVRFAERDVADWGAPLLGVSVGVGFSP